MATGADDIVQNIKLEGSAEFLAGLASMAAGAQKAFGDIEKAANQAGAGIDNAGNKVSSAGGGFNRLKSDLKDVGKAFVDLGNSAANVGGVIANKFTAALATLGISLTLAGFAKFVADAAKAADELDTLSRITGSTTQELQGIQFAAANASVGTDELNNALRLLERSLGQAQQDIISFNNKLQSIGITASRAADDLSRSTSQQLADLKTNADFQDKLAKATTAGARASLTAEKAVADIRTAASRQSQQNFLTQQRAIADLNREFSQTPNIWRRLKIAVTEGDGTLRSTLNVLSDLADEFKRLPDGPQKTAFALEALGRQGAQLIPLLNEGSAAIKKFAEEAKTIAPPLTAAEVEIGQKFQVALLRLSKAFESVSGASAALIQPGITAFFDDLTSVIVANRQAILSFAKDLGDKLGSVLRDVGKLIRGDDLNLENSWIKTVKDDVTAFAKATKAAFEDIIIPAFKLFLRVLDDVAQALNKFFGTQFTGGELGIVIAVGLMTGAFGLLNKAIQVVIASLLVLLRNPIAAAFVLGFAAVMAVLDKIQGKSTTIGDALANVGKKVEQVFGLEAPASIKKTEGAFDDLKNTFDKNDAALAKLKPPVPDFATLKATADAAARDIILAFDNGNVRVKQSFIDMNHAVVQEVFQIPTAFAQLADQLAQTFAPVADEVQTIFLNTQARLVDAFNQLAEQVQPSADTFANSFITANDRVEQSFQQLQEQVDQTFQSMEQDAISAASRIDQAFQDLESGGGGGGQGFASGGFVQGPGSSTSDSILARLSAGEFVISARAVRKYGVGVMSMINSLRAPLGGLRGFYNGGFVSDLMAPLMSGIPRFATGGPVAGQGTGKSVNIHIGQDVFKLFARDNDTLNKLERAAIRKEMTSAGRKPSYYR